MAFVIPVIAPIVAAGISFLAGHKVAKAITSTGELGRVAENAVQQIDETLTGVGQNAIHASQIVRDGLKSLADSIEKLGVAHEASAQILANSVQVHARVIQNLGGTLDDALHRAVGTLNSAINKLITAGFIGLLLVILFFAPALTTLNVSSHFASLWPILIEWHQLIIFSIILGALCAYIHYSTGVLRMMLQIEQLQRVRSLSDMVPIGTILSFTANIHSLPNNWLPCDGRTLSKAQYQQLFQCIGNVYGDTDLHFNLPDFRGIFLRGLDYTNPAGALTNLDPLVNRTLGVLQLDHTKLPNNPFVTSSDGSHSHDLPKVMGWSGGESFGYVVNKHGGKPGENIHHSGNHRHSVVGGDLETCPKNLAVYYIIRVQ